jgi:hypothetical protein
LSPALDAVRVTAQRGSLHMSNGAVPSTNAVEAACGGQSSIVAGDNLSLALWPQQKSVVDPRTCG